MIVRRNAREWVSSECLRERGSDKENCKYFTYRSEEDEIERKRELQKF